MTARQAPEERQDRLVPVWDNIVGALLVLVALALALSGWDDVINGREVLAIQAAVVGAAFLGRRA